MKNRDGKGLICLVLIVILIVASVWLLMRSSKHAMRENASPGSAQQSAPQTPQQQQAQQQQ